MKRYELGTYKVQRAGNGRFSSFKAKVRKVWFWSKVSAVSTALGASLIGIGFVLAASNTVAAENNVTIVDKTPETIADLTEELANVVHQGESQGRVMKPGEIFSVFDPSNAMRARCMQPDTVRSLDCESYGPYQEKIGTIMHYALSVYGHEVTQTDAMIIANDNEKAKDFFIECSVKVAGCALNWTAANNDRQHVEWLVNELRKLEKISPTSA